MPIPPESNSGGQLETSEGRWRELFEYAPVGLCQVSTASIVVAINHTLLAWLGYRHDEVAGHMTCDAFLRQASHQPLWNMISRCQRLGRVEGVELEFRARNKSHGFVGQMTVMALFDHQGNFAGWRGSVVDVTRAKAIDQRLLQALTLDVMEKLVGRAAHRIEAVLQTAQSYAELGSSRLTTTHPIHGNLVRIKEAVQQAVSLVHRLEAFSRYRRLQQQELNLNDLVSTLSARLRLLLPEYVNLTLLLRAERPIVYGNRNCLEQVLMNIATNACDAMPYGGSMALETSNVTLDEAYCQQYPGFITPGNYVCMTIADTGLGMDPTTLVHIFEPFFTTKEMGDGLGLSFVWGSVKQHQGYLDVTSIPGQGTTLRVLLPEHL